MKHSRGLTAAILGSVAGLLIMGSGGGAARAQGPFHIVISPNATLAANTPALDAFNRAAKQWENYFLDPITVTINASLVDFGDPLFIGITNPLFLSNTYDSRRDLLIADAADEGADDAIVAFLPTASQVSFLSPAGTTWNGNLSATKANLKALGVSDLDTNFGVSDGTIQFNSGFAFDFDNSDGVLPGAFDFESVAAHEIGHVLGFASAVDNINNGATTFAPRPLDLFRFQNNVAGRDPSTPEEFTLFPRMLTPGGASAAEADHIFDDISNEWRLSTGANTGRYPNIDGRQASHWKDDEITGDSIGMMDPTLSSQRVLQISRADLRAFDLIGYDLVSAASPEPTTLGLLGSGAAGFALFSSVRRRRRRNR